MTDQTAQATQQPAPPPAQSVTAGHAQDAAPGNIVTPLANTVGLADVPGAISQHASHVVPHPKENGKWVTRGSFRLHVLNDVTEKDGIVRTLRVVTSREPEEGEMETVTVYNDSTGQEETRSRPKDASFTHNLDPRIQSAAKSNGLSVKVMAHDQNGAELEFSKAAPKAAPKAAGIVDKIEKKLGLKGGTADSQ